jgi:hypothetical protein
MRSIVVVVSLAWLSLLLVVPRVMTYPADKDEAPKDYTGATLRSVGIEAVTPRKDPKTGFVEGGKNATALVRGLPEIAGQSIAKLEKRMRPGQDSRAGFLGKDESLLEVLAADNRYVVDELGLSHQEIAKHLHIIGAIAAKQASTKAVDILYRGQRLRLQSIHYKGFQDSPFDDGTKTSIDATVENVGSGKKLTFSLLLPHMIERYGFYEGKGTPYRVDSRAVLEVLELVGKK